ncbi:MAG: arsenate reductase ArsC [Aestuariivita sp.]|nr:arsenate reductase ArsC [Aestuariivita sp.]
MNLLILCTGNSARSILLEHIFNGESNRRVTAWSAGSCPTGTVDPQALKLLQTKGYHWHMARSKSWDEFAKPDAPHMDVVLTVCSKASGETCPLWPGAPVRGHWGVNDPAAAPEDHQAEAFKMTFQELYDAAHAFLDQKFEAMTPEELTVCLREIGSSL